MQRLFSIVLVVLLVLSCLSQAAAQSERAIVGDSQVATYAADVKSALNIPSLAVGVVGQDGIQYLDVDGEASADAAFLIGSLSRGVTAAVVVVLERENELSFDDSASRWVEGVPEEVTVEDLLYERSGLEDYELLGTVIERVSGQSYAEVVDEKIFGPLGMEDASAAPEPPSNRAQGHQYLFGFPVAFGEPESDPSTVSSRLVWMSAEDMARWVGAMSNQGVLDGRQVLAPEVVERLLEVDEQDDIAMGWSVEEKAGADALTDTGLTGAFSASVAMVPERDVAVFAMANVNSWEGSAATSVVDSVLGAALSGEPKGHSNLEFLVRLAFGLLCLFAVFLFLKELVEWLTRDTPTGLDGAAQKAVVVDIAIAAALIVGVVFLTGASPLEMASAAPDLGYGLIGLVILLPLRRLLHGFNASDQREITTPE